MSSPISQTNALVVGSGPNGLAAAIELARAGLSVTVLEAKATAGGGARTEELTLPGFLHDVCSAIYPLGLGSPFFRKLPLERHGLQWIHPPVPLAHPFDDGKAAVLYRSIRKTAATLGRDEEKYRRFMSSFVNRWHALAQDILGPPLHLPRHPLTLSLFAASAFRSAAGLSKSLFRDTYARGLFAGLSAHSFLPLERHASAAFGIILGALGHAVGWPFPRGGAQQLINAMLSYLHTFDCQIRTGAPVESFDQLTGKVNLLDVTPRQILSMATDRLPYLYRKQLEGYHYGPGVFKIDWALDAPIPWKAAECRLAGTVHLGGTLEEIMQSEADVWAGNHPMHPFVLAAQQSLFDDSRAPAGKHTGWAYCHVPNNSSFDMTDRIERQVERFAPGFRQRILARHTRTASEFERYNPNCIGGDINGGVQDLRQIIMRPALKFIPYATPVSGVYICSSSTPPGGGVHGLCGYHAARAAIKELRKSNI
jgi:phytoene dehydrogenase-like protein